MTEELQRRLADVTLRDEHRLRRRLDVARRLREKPDRERALAAVGAEIGKAAKRVEARAASVPDVSYPAELPVSQQRETCRRRSGRTRSSSSPARPGRGRRRSCPKLCLELGRGIRGQIGHTQPRRLAARTVAERIASELGTPLGETVGYQVRFSDHSGDRTLVKLMTDGILLAEIQRDRMLRGYDTIILDEAHERSLNIDFLLGYLKQLLPRRPELKLIITSATLDPERFSRHFDDAPIVEVSGRTYPVEVRYRPLGDDGDRPRRRAARRRRSRPTSTRRSATPSTSSRREGPGDTLVFLSGEREIRDAADALRRPERRPAGGPAALRPALRRRAGEGLPTVAGAAGWCCPPTSPRRR